MVRLYRSCYIDPLKFSIWALTRLLGTLRYSVNAILVGYEYQNSCGSIECGLEYQMWYWSSVEHVSRVCVALHLYHLTSYMIFTDSLCAQVESTKSPHLEI